MASPPSGTPSNPTPGDADEHPAVVAARDAPVDDEPETESERAAVDEAKRDVAAGRVLTTEQLRRALGL